MINANITDLTIETVNVKGMKVVVIPLIKSCPVTAPEAVPAI
jgi:hypothetical protein